MAPSNIEKAILQMIDVEDVGVPLSLQSFTRRTCAWDSALPSKLIHMPTSIHLAILAGIIHTSLFSALPWIQ